ncbi:MAG: MarR family winged helix-turn-helix transcriptional regulator [Oscillospiraceae bacterium]|nr:MarR family winged helix-turn-helix transcriptional regulator [Oscillospiraceae bacterium]
MACDESLVEELLRRLPRGGRYGAGHQHQRGGMAIVLMHSLYGGGQSPSALSALLGVSGPRVTAILNDLETRGLICRTQTAADRRSVAVTLTAAGAAFVEEHDRSRRAQVERLVERIGPADAQALIRILQAAEELRRGSDGTA